MILLLLILKYFPDFNHNHTKKWGACFMPGWEFTLPPNPPSGGTPSPMGVVVSDSVWPLYLFIYFHV